MDMEAAMKRIPPHSAEAEQAVLGAMLMNKEAISMERIFIRLHMGFYLTVLWKCFSRESR